jgi:hypothetical protein
MLGKALLVLLPCCTAACVSVRPVLAPATFVSQQQPELVWVHAADHAAHPIPLGQPRVVGDSLHGLWVGTGERLSLPLSGVQMVARQPAKGRTALLVASAALVAGFIVWRASDDSGLPSGCVFDARSGWYCPP